MTHSSAPAVSPSATVWEFDPAHSLVEFSARHMMVATVKGRFTTVRGRIVDVADDPARSSVEVEIDAASIDSRDERRDGHLKSADFLDVEHFPSITFTSTRVEPLGGDRLRLTGDLQIRGVSRPITFEASLNGRGKTPYGTEVAGFSAEAQLNRKDWGLNWNVALEAGGVLVSDQIKVAIEIQAVRA
jgi:polyisoprenoid-binding protein YceI